MASSSSRGVSPSMRCGDAVFINKGSVEYVAKFGGKFVGQTGLHEEACAALTLRPFAQRRGRVSSEQDDRNISRSGVALQIVNQLPPVTTSQGEVRDDDVWVEFPSPAASLGTISNPDYVEIKPAEALDVQLTRVVVIVDDKDQRSGRAISGTTTVHAAAWYLNRKEESRLLGTRTAVGQVADVHSLRPARQPVVATPPRSVWR